MEQLAHASPNSFVERTRFRQHKIEPINTATLALIRGVNPFDAQLNNPKLSINVAYIPLAQPPEPNPSVLLEEELTADSIRNHLPKKVINSFHQPTPGHHRLPHPIKGKSKLQLALISLAVVMILGGAYMSVNAWQANAVTELQANALTAFANKEIAKGGALTTTSSSQPLSTTKPAPSTVAAYAVAPNYPKYLVIPSIGVDAIVGQVGLLASGALGTPSNVFYTDWYTGSAEPGQPGATLIDGHVSSWTAHGVFYDLHTLKPGDAIQIVKGNNTVVNYQVVKTQIYPAGNVNMQAAITAITPGVSGLNLITCTGQVIAGTSLFNERVIVFAQEVT